MADNEFRIETDSPAKDDLMFWRIVGHEALARPSFYELTVLSKNRAIDAKDILGRAFDVVIEFLDSDGGTHERHCQGHAVRFTRVQAAGRYFEYRIALRSWFWLLTKRSNSRILQDKKVLEVLDAVFEDSPIKRFKKTKPGKVIGAHKPRRYCVQHLESDYRYLSRLLEDEGIYYWFDAHDAPGTMHLSDASDIAHDKLPVADTLNHMAGNASEARFNEISQWVSARQFDTGKHASRDSDFKAINKTLGANVDAADDHELADFEAFDFPGGYFSGEDAESSAKVRAEELGARRDRHWAFTAWPDVTAGRSFAYKGDPDRTRDGDYFIAACTFVASHPGYEGLHIGDAPEPLALTLREALDDDAVGADTRAVLEALIARMPDVRGGCAFLLTVLPMDMPFRPPRLTPRVVMPGPQTAIVVGAKGKEHDVDEFGRVKVHFFWDRYDESDEKSTCWVRVSQPWAGKGWGGYFAPRIGQEVIVDFINGNPDRPIIVGRVYNDEQGIPYKSATQSGFRTRSTPGGSPSNYNEIMFEDQKGSELVNIHAERNMSTSVEVDDSTSVGHDQSLTVENDRHVTVKKFETHVVGKNQDVEIHGYNTSKIGKDYALLVTGNLLTQTKGFRTDVSVLGELRTVGVGQTIGVSGPVVHGSASLAVTTGEMSVTTSATKLGASGDISVTAGGARKDVATGSHTIASSAGIKLVAGADIDLMAYANINATSMGSNTTVLGSNSSGYIGSSSEANMGMARSTFMGLQMSNFLGVSIDNALAIQMENCAALQMHNVAALDLTNTPADIECTAVKIIQPGAGAGGAAGAAVVGALGGLVAGVLGLGDAAATMKQYADAAQALRDAAKDIPELPGLQTKLNALADSADRRQRQVGTAVGAGVGAAVGFVAGGPLGAAAGAAVGSQLGGNYLPGAATKAAGFVDDHTKGVGEAADKAWDAAMPAAGKSPGPQGGSGGSNPVGS